MESKAKNDGRLLRLVIYSRNCLRNDIGILQSDTLLLTRLVEKCKYHFLWSDYTCSNLLLMVWWSNLILMNSLLLSFVWSKILDSALFLFSQVQPRKKYAFLKAATASSSSIFDANAHCFKFNPKCTINFNQLFLKMGFFITTIQTLSGLHH